MTMGQGRGELPISGKSRMEGDAADDEEDHLGDPTNMVPRIEYTGGQARKRPFNALSHAGPGAQRGDGGHGAEAGHAHQAAPSSHGHNAQLSRVGQGWKNTLEQYGVLSSSKRLDQECLQRTPKRLHEEGDLAAAEQLAAAAAGCVQAKQVRRLLPDAQPLSAGRPTLKRLELVSGERCDNTLPGLAGTLASMLARSMLSSASGTPDGGAICAICGRSGESDSGMDSWVCSSDKAYSATSEEVRQ